MFFVCVLEGIQKLKQKCQEVILYDSFGGKQNKPLTSKILPSVVKYCAICEILYQLRSIVPVSSAAWADSRNHNIACKRESSSLESTSADHQVYLVCHCGAAYFHPCCHSFGVPLDSMDCHQAQRRVS